MKVPSTMKCAVYSADHPEGVKVTTRTVPSLRDTTRRTFLVHLLSIISRIVGFLFKICRFFLPFIPPPYGHNPSRKQLLVRVTHAALNPVDAKFLYGDKLPPFFLPFIRRVLDGFICGIDFAGVVVDVEPGCRFKPGDCVFGVAVPPVGTFAEYIAVFDDSVSIRPVGVLPEVAAAIPLVGLTALQAFTDTSVTVGSHVLVIGASGGTGHVAVQIAAALGATVIAICSHRNVPFVQRLGATHVFSYDDASGVDVVQRLGAFCAKENIQFDVVFDSVSSHDPRDATAAYESRISRTQPRLLAPQGTYILIGGLAGDWFRAHLKRFLGINLFKRGRLLFWVRFPCSSQYLEQLGRYLADGKLNISLAHPPTPFSENAVRSLFRDQMSRRTVGKLTVKFI